MNAQATRRGIPAVALWGGFGALAWAAITVLTGGSSAQADEQSGTPLLDGVTSLVSETVSTVGETVTAVAQPVVTEVVQPVVTDVVHPVVTQVVAPVVTQVAAPVQQAAPAVVETVTETVAEVPVVGPATAPIVEAVADTTQSVVTPVADLLQNAPASQLIDPVQDAVGAVPVLGTLLGQLGVFALLDDLTGVVDETTGLVGGVVANTLTPVVTVLDPDASDAVGYSAASASAVSHAPLPATSAPAAPRALTAEREPSSTLFSTAPATSIPSSEGDAAPVQKPAGAPAAPSTSAGSGGASGLSHARLSDVGVPPLRAVEWTSGASDDVLPTSLIADTDVSPD